MSHSLGSDKVLLDIGVSISAIVPDYVNLIGMNGPLKTFQNICLYQTGTQYC